MYCSIGNGQCSRSECSCLNYKDMMSFVVSYNKYCIKNKKLDKCIQIISGKKRKNISLSNLTFHYLNELKQKLCTDGKCDDLEMIEKFKNEISDNIEIVEILRNKFKPIGPLNHDWLSNFDIDNTMQQYSSYYKNFLYIGTLSSDFNKDKFLKFFDKIIVRNNFGIRYIGTIYNTDTSNGPGEHWISSFVDANKKKIYYYDSYGLEPSFILKTFLLNLNNLLFGSENQLETNKIRHQYGNSECGVFCLYFITSMIEGNMSFTEYCNQENLKDAYVNKNRSLYFRSNK